MSMTAVIARVTVTALALSIMVGGLGAPARADDVVELTGTAGAAWMGAQGPAGAVSGLLEGRITAQVVGDEVRLSLWSESAPTRVYQRIDLERGVPDGQAWVRRLVGWDGSVCEPGFDTKVRTAQYGTDGVPEVLDLSLRAGCPDGARTVELRIGSTQDFGLVLAESGWIAALPGTQASMDLTVTNVGGSSVTLGDLVDSEGRWTFSGCVDSILGAEQSCELTATYYARAQVAPREGSTFQLPVTTDDGVEQLAASLNVAGWTAMLPRPAGARLTEVAGDTYVTWILPMSNPGFTITGWQIRRQGDATPLTTVPYATRHLKLPSVDEGDIYEVSIVTDFGVGPPAQTSRTVEHPTQFQIGVGALASSVREGGPGSWIVTPLGAELPLVVDGHEFTTPSADPRGLAVVLARAETAGAGADDWDLWETGIHPDSFLLRLTDLPGQETDPQFSPDGKTIAFTYRPTPTSVPEVWTAPALPDGFSPPPMPTATRRFVGASHPSWRTDDELVAADERAAGAPLVRLRLGGSGVTIAGTYAGTGGARQPTVAWDGRTVAYVTSGGAPMRLDLAGGAVTAEVLEPAAGTDVRFGNPSFTLDGNVAWTQDRPGDDLAARLSRAGDNLGFTEYLVVPRVTTAPAVSFPGAPAVVRPGITYPLEVEDAMLRSVVTTCRIDGRAAIPCSAGIPTAGLADGTHRVVVTATNPRATTTASATFRVDGTAPSTATVRGPRRTVDERVIVTSAATDNDGIESFDGRERIRYLGRNFTSWHRTTLNGRPGMAVVQLEPGETRCLSARARDAAGNIGPWSPEHCVSRIVDDRGLRHSKEWRYKTVTGAVGRTVSTARHDGAIMRSRERLGSGHVVLVARTCRRCGAIDVYSGTRLVAHLELRGKARWHEFAVRYQKPGKLLLVTTSARRVDVDGYYPTP